MTRTLFRTSGPMRVVRQALAAALLALAGAANAQSSSDYALADGVAIYYAVLPAEMLRGYPSGSDEARMHGGVPGGRHVHHLQIALFDAATGARIDDARVTARVAETGLGGEERELEPFAVGDALTYGGYFEFQNRALYRIEVRAALPDGGRVIEKTFEYRHQ